MRCCHLKYEEKINILPYIFMVFILSSYIYVLLYKNKWLAIIIAGCFFIILIFKVKLKISMILIAFFIVPLINNFYYNNIFISNKEEVRIISINSYGAIGEIAKRKVYMNGNIKNVKLGEKFIIKGEFTRDVNREKGIIGEFKVEGIEKLDSDLKERIYKLREYIFSKLKEKLGYRRAAIVTSIAFGYTEFLDRDDKEDMKSLGILHAISVSGLHMVLVYSILKRIFGEKVAPIISAVYVIFSGAALSTIRAYIMMVCMNFSLPLKRNYNPIAALSMSGIILMIFKPYSIFEVGFQLSFLATLGIIIFNKSINKRLYRFPKFFREGISICLSSQIFTFPVLVCYFKEFSFGFLLGNLILVPLMNIVVILGNLLALVINFEMIFNYIAFLAYYITMFIDIGTKWLLNITPNPIYLNELINISYIIILITIYFYKEGYKKALYFPTVIIIYFYMLIYSPLPKIEYFKEGIIAVSFRGERAICALKKDVDLEKFKVITLSQNTYKDFNNIKINKNFNIEKNNKDIILKGRDNSYLIKLSKGKNSSNYDIIDFKSENYGKIILIDNKALVFN
jgi:competence protein ComEC